MADLRSSFSTVFQLYQDDGWSDNGRLCEKISVSGGAGTARSAGQHLTYWASGDPQVNKNSRTGRKKFMIISCMLYVCTSCAIDKSLIHQSNIASHNTQMGAQENKASHRIHALPSPLMHNNGVGGGLTFWRWQLLKLHIAQLRSVQMKWPFIKRRKLTAFQALLKSFLKCNWTVVSFHLNFSQNSRLQLNS